MSGLASLRPALLLPILTACVAVSVSTPATAQSFASRDSAWSLQLARTSLKTSVVNGTEFSFEAGRALEVSHREELSANVYVEVTAQTPMRHRISEYQVSTKTYTQTATLTTLPVNLIGNLTVLRMGDFDFHGGAGVNLTGLAISDSTSPPWTLKKRYATGLLFQAGADYTTDWGWRINLNFRRSLINTSLQLQGSLFESTLGIDPWTVSMGASYSF